MERIDQLISSLNTLIDVQKAHNEAINALFESNQQLIDILLADNESEDPAPRCYLDGTPL